MHTVPTRRATATAEWQELEEWRAEIARATAIDVEAAAQGVSEALMPLHEALREVADMYCEILDRQRPADVSEHEMRAVRAHLALHHRVADMITGALAGWSPAGGSGAGRSMLRAGLYEALGTEQLVYLAESTEAERPPAR